MKQRVRLLFAVALPSLLLAVWATFLVVGGATPLPVSGGSVVLASPVNSARFDGPKRNASPRPEMRRATVTAVQEAVAAESIAQPPGTPPALADPVPPRYRQPVLRGETVQPRQERAPPHDPYSPRHTRAPPSTRSS